MSDDQNSDVWQSNAELNIDGLVEALASDDAKVRQRAAAALKSLGAVQALPALRTAYTTESDPQTRHVLATAVAALKISVGENEVQAMNASPEPSAPPQSETQRLIARLKSENTDTVIQAATELGERGDKLAVEPLVLLFNDQRRSIHVRLAVAEALLKLESAPVEVALLANLRHSDWQIRRNGAAILGQLQAEWAIQPLARALNDPHPTVRRTALAALKNIGTPESRKALAQHTPNHRNRTVNNRKGREQISGLDVKHPGQDKNSTGRSGMLTKHLEGTEEPSLNSKVTRPLDASMLEEIEQKRRELAQSAGEDGADTLAIDDDESES